MAKSEVEWTQNSLIPLLRRVGFRRVEFTHGVLEAGRDVVFADYDRFGLVKYYAAQVKDGDLRAKSETQEVRIILDQVKHVYETPHLDVATGTKHRIASVYLIVNGKVSDAAKQLLFARAGSWLHIVDSNQLGVAKMLTCQVADSDRRHAFGFLELEIGDNRRILEPVTPSIAAALKTDSKSTSDLGMPTRLLSTRWLEAAFEIARHELDYEDISLLSTFLRLTEQINFLLIKIPIGAVANIQPTLTSLQLSAATYLDVAPLIEALLEFVQSSARPAPGERLDTAPS